MTWTRLIIILAWLAQGCGSGDDEGQPSFASGDLEEVSSQPLAITAASDYEEISVPANDSLPSAKRKFIWPVDGWITATEVYADGDNHSGSADISTLYWMPIVAARDGKVVTVSGMSTYGGYYVSLDHGNGYSTLYSHLAEKPALKVGQTVKTGQVIGRVSRTGNASTAHCHFAIYKKSGSSKQRLPIPDLQRGVWVKQGDFIAGSYPELAAIKSRRVRLTVKVTEDKLNVRSTASQSGKIVKTLSLNSLVKMDATDDGYFRIASGQWIVKSGAMPQLSPVYGLKSLKDAKVYETASTSGKVYGTISLGSLHTGTLLQSGWHRILLRLGKDTTVKYRYVRSSDMGNTALFRVKVVAKSVNLRAGPGTNYDVVDNVQDMQQKGYFTVREVKQGWYRIKYNGKDVWVSGWLTTGRV